MQNQYGIDRVLRNFSQVFFTADLRYQTTSFIFHLLLSSHLPASPLCGCARFSPTASPSGGGQRRTSASALRFASAAPHASFSLSSLMLLSAFFCEGDGRCSLQRRMSLADKAHKAAVAHPSPPSIPAPPSPFPLQHETLDGAHFVYLCCRATACLSLLRPCALIVLLRFICSLAAV